MTLVSASPHAHKRLRTTLAAGMPDDERCTRAVGRIYDASDGRTERLSTVKILAWQRTGPTDVRARQKPTIVGSDNESEITEIAVRSAAD